MNYYSQDVTLDCETYGIKGHEFNQMHPEHRTLFNGFLKFGKVYQDLTTGFNKDARLNGFNLKYDAKCLMKQGFNLKTTPFYDGKVAVHMLRSDLTNDSLKLESLANALYGYPNYKGLVDFDGEYWEDMEGLKLYNSHDLFATELIKKKTEPLLKSKGLWPLFLMVMQFLKELSKIEMKGLAFDEQELNRQGAVLTAKRAKLLEELRNYADIDWASSAQVGEYLIGKGYKVPKARTGRHSTKESVLLELLATGTGCPEATLLLELRGVDKQLGTYILGVKAKLVNGIYYPDYSLTGPESGRMSEHYIQLFPRSDTSDFKKCIVSKFIGGLLIEGDWGQQEVRMIAERSGDQNLIRELNSGFDLHAETLRKFLSALKVRTRAKNAVFNVFFGGGIWILVKEYGLTEQEARSLQADLRSRYPGVFEWHNEMEWLVNQGNPIPSLVGRLRYNPTRNEAINHPVQSTCSEFNKVMVCEINPRFEKEGFLSHLVMDCHDSLVTDTSPLEKDDVLRVLKEEYGNFKQHWYKWFKKELVMDYPVEFKIGKNLFDMEKVK